MYKSTLSRQFISSNHRNDLRLGWFSMLSSLKKFFGADSNDNKHKMTVTHELDVPFKQATFGMGCFWSGDCVFGVTQGVLRTSVGYAGGVTPNPAYKNIADHTEVIQVDFDPNVITYADLLMIFWKNHEYGLTTKLKRQYMSLVLYHDDEQKAEAERSKKQEEERRRVTFVTEIRKVGSFYPAEDYHQKFKLQRHSYLVSELGLKGKLLQRSHVAARLNGYVVGLGGLSQFENEITALGLSDKVADYVRTQLIKNEGGSLSC